MENILEVKNLVKKYGNITAVDDISFEVRKGSLFAFLGPNGAGKSTTIKIITTLLKKDEGSVFLNGRDDPKYTREKIGVVFQDNVLDDLLTVKENLYNHGMLYLNSKKEVDDKYREISEFLFLKEIEKRKYKTLSGGQKRRVEIARAIFSNPEILLLDEPTTGLDPETRKMIWEAIDRLKKEKNMTIFLTTHYMEEAADADHIVIINKGKIVAEGTPNKLKTEYSYDVFKIVPNDKEKLVNDLKDMNRSFKKIADQFIMKINDSNDAIFLIDKFKSNIKNFEVIKGTLDDVFINVIGELNNE